MTSPASSFIVVMIISLLALVISVFNTGNTYRKYSYEGHLWITIGFILIIITQTLRLITEFLGDLQQVQTFWFMSNFFLTVGFWILLLALLLSQYDRLPKRSHFISILSGILIGLFANPALTNISRDVYSYNAKYDATIGLSVLMITLIFLFSFLRPLFLKIRRNPSSYKSFHVISILITYLVLVIWAVSTLMTSNPLIRTLRIPMFSLALFFWSASLTANPLVLNIASARVNAIIIFNQSGLAYCSWNADEDTQQIDPQLLSNLISALKMSAESLTGRESTLKRLTFQDSHIYFINGHRIVLALITDSVLSSNLHLMTKVYINYFEKHYAQILRQDVINTDIFSNEPEIIQQFIRSVTVS